MLAASWIPEDFKSNTGDLLWALGVLVGFLSAFSPKTPIGKMVRWLWRRNVGEPVGNWARGLIRETVEPMIAKSRSEIMSAAKTQHDTQNQKLDGIDKRTTKLEAAIARPHNAKTRKDD